MVVCLSIFGAIWLAIGAYFAYDKLTSMKSDYQIKSDEKHHSHREEEEHRRSEERRRSETEPEPN